MRDVNNGAFGATLPELPPPTTLLRQQHISTVPVLHPAVTKENLNKLGIVGQYSGIDGKRPQALPVPKVAGRIESLVHVPVYRWASR